MRHKVNPEKKGEEKEKRDTSNSVSWKLDHFVDSTERARIAHTDSKVQMNELFMLKQIAAAPAS